MVKGLGEKTGGRFPSPEANGPKAAGRYLARERERTLFVSFKMKNPQNVTLGSPLTGCDRMEIGRGAHQRTTVYTTLGWVLEGRVGKHTILSYTCGAETLSSVIALLWASVSPQNPEAALTSRFSQIALGLAVTQTCS